MKYIYIKEHKTEQGTLVALCDKELLGKTLDNNGVPFVVSKTFYGGHPITPPEILTRIKNCSHANIIGKRSVNYLLNEKLIDERFIIQIGEHPHVILIKM